jgi:hypothetical protein
MIGREGHEVQIDLLQETQQFFWTPVVQPKLSRQIWKNQKLFKPKQMKLGFDN